MYLDAEGSFSAGRLAAMLGGKGADAAAIEAALAQRVAVVAPAGAADAAARLRALAAARPPGLALLLIDSIAALVGAGSGGEAPPDLIARAAAVAGVAAAAKGLADATGCAVLAVNQVVAPRGGAAGGGGGSGSAAVVAALGPGWAHAVTTRLVVEARPWPGGVGLAGSGGAAVAAGGLRWVWVAKSPSAPAAAAPFIIGPGGPAPPPPEVAEAALAAAGGGLPPRPPWASSGEGGGGGGDGEGGVLGAALWGDVGLPEGDEE